MKGSGKLNAYRFGRWAETLSCWRLKLVGYAIQARRYKVAVGEIDLIARRGNLLAFIEVKARQDQALATHSLSPFQRRRIEAAAEAFLKTHPEFADCQCRFDLITVTPWGWPQHLKGAWLSGD